MLSNLCLTTFCFLSPLHHLFFCPKPFFTLHIKGAGFQSGCGVEREKQRKSKRPKNEPALAEDTEERNTKLLLLLTLKSPVSPIPSSLLPSLPFLLLSLSQLHLFTLTGLERGLASPAVSHLCFYSLACLVSFLLLLTLKKTPKKERSGDEIFSLDISVLSCFGVESLLPLSFDFINKWSAVASSTGLSPVYMAELFVCPGLGSASKFQTLNMDKLWNASGHTPMQSV